MRNETKRDVYEQVGVAMTCRSYQEYVDMFQLTPDIMGRGPILDVAAGASSFVAEANARGYDAVAADPLFGLDGQTIYAKGKREIEESTRKLAGIAHTFHWEYYGSLERHRQGRECSLEKFAQSFLDDGQRQSYVPAELPRLPFADGQFALVLCSHFLFLYHQQFDFSFHQQAVTELVRVCRPGGEVRLYPLVGINREPYPHLSELLDALRAEGVRAEQVPTPFRFLQGATRFLRICT
jgi:SAM-dependent methyltransferase